MLFERETLEGGDGQLGDHHDPAGDLVPIEGALNLLGLLDVCLKLVEHLFLPGL